MDVDEVKTKQKVYDDGSTYYYICTTTQLDAALSDPVWNVKRITQADGSSTYAEGSYNSPATDLATVQALTYQPI